MSVNGLRRASISCLVLAACQHDLEDIDGIFYDGDGRTVHCGINLDSKNNFGFATIDAALDRAVARGEVIELYAHSPGKTVEVAVIEYVLAGARDRGLPYVTYADFAAGGGRGAGLALSFDDTSTEAWIAMRPQFQDHGARITFFVSRYAGLDEEGRGRLRELANDGHAIEAHSANHLNAPTYVEEHGLAAYVRDELLPSLEVLRADGFDVTSFAYPFGARTSELDDEIAKHVPIIRSVSFAYSGVVSPCPR